MKTAYLVAGLAYGDEGKGATVDYLCRQYAVNLVVRYNGGAQAAHNVVDSLNPSKHHTFAQFGSGTLAGANTYISKHVLIEPRFMLNEAKHLEELGVKQPFSKLLIHENALVITPFQIAANRIIEDFRKKNKIEHGSCGMGIGQTRSDFLQYGEKVLFAGDLQYKSITENKLYFLRGRCRETIEETLKTRLNKIDHAESSWFAYDSEIDYLINEWYLKFPGRNLTCESDEFALRGEDGIVFEGAQGMLLDEKYGEPDHNTWTDITFNNANELLANANFDGKIEKVGVLRSYFTRHGVGPFEENSSLSYPEPHNSSFSRQGKFRIGDFNFKLARYAFNAIGGVDIVALNHLDYIEESKRKEFVEKLSNTLQVSRFVLGFGPAASNRKERLVNLNDDYFNDYGIRRGVCCS